MTQQDYAYRVVGASGDYASRKLYIASGPATSQANYWNRVEAQRRERYEAVGVPTPYATRSYPWRVVRVPLGAPEEIPAK